MVPDFLFLWLIHSLFWFVLSVLAAVLRGGYNAMRPRSAVAMALASTALQTLSLVYIRMHWRLL
jgi:hypothetical protein